MNQVNVCEANSKSYLYLKEVPEFFISALLVSEDINFYHHNGFDFYEMKESFLTNLKKGAFFRGGSTISQQFVKNAFLSNEKSLIRKLKEAFLTIELEKKYEKDLILEKYLNLVELGPYVFGLKTASHYYFNKEVEHLTLFESSYLVHLLPNPIKYSKKFHKNEPLSNFSIKKIKINLERLLVYKKISKDLYNEALKEMNEFNLEKDLTF